MKFEEYIQHDGLGLANLVKKKEVTPSELVECAINRVEKINPKINSVVLPMYDFARQKAAEFIQKGSIFSGVPFLYKDLNTDVKGFLMRNGSKAFKNNVSNQDTELVKRYKQAGLIGIGKTNTPEFGLRNITESLLYGACRNPWNTALSPGGSSGGAAASIASGITPIASGGDGGGSIRIPASYCGLFGLKPSRGRIPTGPKWGDKWQGATVQHVLTRSVRDSAAALDATCGMMPGSLSRIPKPQSLFIDELNSKKKKLKIGYLFESPIETPVDRDCIAAVNQSILTLEELGHEVELVKWPVDGFNIAKSYIIMYFGEVHAAIKHSQYLSGVKIKLKDLELATRVLYHLGKKTPAGDFAWAMKVWGRSARQMANYYQKYDILVTPTTGRLPSKIGELEFKGSEKFALRLLEIFGLTGLIKTSGMAMKLAFKNLSYSPFTQIANITGLPAMTVPLFWNKDNIPLGTHFVGAMGKEDVLLQLGKQIEEFKPWDQKIINLNS